jgi:hypothetical protein
MTDILGKIDRTLELSEKIENSTTLEDTQEVAIELYSTLGFCHGFLEKERMIIPEYETSDFPWNSRVWLECDEAYAEEYTEGMKFRKEME